MSLDPVWDIPVSFTLRGNVSVRAATRAEAVQLAASGFYMFCDVKFGNTDVRCEEWNMDLSPTRTIGHDLRKLWVLATDDKNGTQVSVALSQEEAKEMFCGWLDSSYPEAAEALRALEFESEDWNVAVDDWDADQRASLDTWTMDSYDLTAPC